MKTINKYMEDYVYLVDEKRYFVKYYHRMAEEEIILSLTNSCEGYYFNYNNTQRGLDRYNFDKNKFGFLEMFKKEQLDEIIQIEINEIRFRLKQKQDKIFHKPK